MDGILSKKRIDYTIFHLEQRITLPEEIKKHFIFNDYSHSKTTQQQGIIFNLSPLPFNESDVVFENYNDEKIPILFPLGIGKKFYELENESLIFNHDLLKSAFYLLSGYQEYGSNDRDIMGRFSYHISIQKKLGFANKPIVNYYFDIISEGIEAYCRKNGIKITKKQPFNDFAFFLSHDVDRIDYYHFYEIALKWKQFLGFAPSKYKKIDILTSAVESSFRFINPLNKKNPWWTFPFFMSIESKYRLKPTYFFLQKDQLHVDSRYSIQSKRIKELIRNLEDNVAEIGLHGTVNSGKYIEKMRSIYSTLVNVVKNPEQIQGIRQHRLMFTYPETFYYQMQTGLKYDSTLGFAEHEGYRNSYCYPFRIYDFSKDEMMNIWEIPLILMDVSVLEYQKKSNDEILKVVNGFIGEAKKFNGLFSMLWHNCRLNENEYKNVRVLYESIIRMIVESNATSLSGIDIINQMNLNRIN